MGGVCACVRVQRECSRCAAELCVRTRARRAPPRRDRHTPHPPVHPSREGSDHLDEHILRSSGWGGECCKRGRREKREREQGVMKTPAVRHHPSSLKTSPMYHSAMWWGANTFKQSIQSIETSHACSHSKMGEMTAVFRGAAQSARTRPEARSQFFFAFLHPPRRRGQKARA